MKRLFTIVLCFLLITAAVYSQAAVEVADKAEEPAAESVSAKEKEADKNIIVYAKVPESWEYPCVWAWDDAGISAFPSWPGDLMEMDSNNAGWHYIYLPSSMTSVIINANDGGIQTKEYRIEGRDAWIVVNDDGSASVSKAKMTVGDLPEYYERFTLYAQVDESWKAPCVWAWEDPSGKNAFAPWPGRTMKANKNGWYSAKVPSWCNSIIINGNGGTVQTADIKELDPADMWLAVAQDGTFELTYADPTRPKVEDITVNVKVPADWLEPCIWAWSHPDGTNAFVSWPGEKLNPEEDGTYALSIPGWINSIIINANGGAVQTADLRVDSGKNLSIVVAGPDSAEFSYK